MKIIFVAGETIFFTSQERTNLKSGNEDGISKRKVEEFCRDTYPDKLIWYVACKKDAGEIKCEPFQAAAADYLYQDVVGFTTPYGEKIMFTNQNFAEHQLQPGVVTKRELKSIYVERPIWYVLCRGDGEEERREMFANAAEDAVEEQNPTKSERDATFVCHQVLGCEFVGDVVFRQKRVPLIITNIEILWLLCNN